MYKKMFHWAVLALAGLVSAGGTASAQDYAPPDPQLIFPFGTTRPEEGGMFGALSYVMMRQTNPLQDQPLAYRGFIDSDGSITGTPGTAVGPGTEALNVNQVTGPNPYQPGYKLEVGWKFSDDRALTLGWMYLFNSRRQAVATGIQPFGLTLPDLSDTFLFSPVYNFPPEYAGAQNDVTVGNPFAAYGIWNAADVMTIDFEQKTQQWDLTYRETIYQTECYRLNGLMGPRFFWIWERFRWRTTDYELDGSIAGPGSVGLYSNIISNRMYGVFLGLQSEYYMGHGFAVMLEGQGSLYLNVVKQRAKYELGAKYLTPANKRALTSYTFVPEARAALSLMWYPYEGIQFKIGWDVMAFFNTMSSPNPVTFDYSGLMPWWSQDTIRFFDGLHATVAISF